MLALLCLCGVRSNAQSPITGTFTVCATATTTLSDADAGGDWNSSNTSVASINSSGVVTGLTAGTTMISYTVTGVGTATHVLTVNAMPTAITGVTSICLGSTSTLASTPSGGTWSSSNSDISIGVSTGVISSSVSAATSTITYLLNGCSVSTTATKLSSAPTITAVDGSPGICLGATELYTASVAGGTWSTSNGNVSVNSLGEATGVVNANCSLYYNLTGACFAQMQTTVYPLPVINTTSTELCLGVTKVFSGGGGNNWTSSNTTIFSIPTFGSGTATLLGNALGTATLTYKNLTSLCQVTRELTVIANPTISGNLHVCQGQTNALTGSPGGGTWASSNTAVASIGSSSGILTGVGSAGTATITYTTTSGCKATAVVTVSSSTGAPNAITGTATLCVGTYTTLSCATGGGAWSSSNPEFATVSSGVVYGVSAGTSTITYELASGCRSTKMVTVNSTPDITGTAVVLVGATTTLGSSIAGGTWISSITSNATIGASSGVVTGVAPGTSLISYTVSTGCRATREVTVNPSICCSTSVCVGNTTTLTGNPAGGSWTPENASVADVNPSGVVAGIAIGTANISYTYGGFTSVIGITVNDNPIITGTATVCNGGTTTLSGSPSGGTWSSSDPSVGIVTSAGVVTAVYTGTAAPIFTTITYTLPTGCIATKEVTVNYSGHPLNTDVPPGVHDLCLGGGNVQLLKTGLGSGTWTSIPTTVATVSSTGLVTPVGVGDATIIFTAASTGCAATYAIHVHSFPTIDGTTTFCYGSTTSLVATPPGGDWYSLSGTSATATSSPSGLISTGTRPGTSTVFYRYYDNFRCDVVVPINVTYDTIVFPSTDTICNNESIDLDVYPTPTSGTDGWQIIGTYFPGVPPATIAGATGVLTANSSGTGWVEVRYANGVDECWGYARIYIDDCAAPKPGTNADAVSSRAYTISPNPSDGNLIISGARYEKPVDVRVVNYVGANVYTGKLNMASGESSLKLNNLAAGLYIVELKGGNDYTGTHKIVIEK